MQIKFLKKEYIDSVILFFNQYTNKQRTRSDWEWEFNSDKLSVQLFVVAEENKRCVGTQALLPIFLRRENSKILSAKSEETLVHPQYRGKKIFNKMYVEIFKKAIFEKIEIIWGFTDAKKPFKAVGFKHFEKGLNNYIFVTSLSRSFRMVLNEIKGIGFKKIIKKIYYVLIFSLFKLRGISVSNFVESNKYNTSIIYDFDKETDELQVTISKELPELITIDRNSSYMKWRVSNNPYYSHTTLGLYKDNELIGYAIVAFLENSLEMNIVDIIIQPNHFSKGLKVLLGAIKKMAKDKKIAYISFKLMPCFNEYTEKILYGIRSAGFYKKRGTLPFVMKVLNNKDEYCNINNWYITGIMTEGVVHN